MFRLEVDAGIQTLDEIVSLLRCCTSTLEVRSQSSLLVNLETLILR